jgi:hypothetical protein
MTVPNDNARQSAFYASPISHFLDADDAAVLGHLAGGSGLAIDGAQTEAWKEQMRVLKRTLPGVDGSLFLHALRGDRDGQHAIAVNDQWRICFRFVDGDAYDVEFCDYH